MIHYTKNEILTDCECALSKPELFYNASMVNYRGETKDTVEPYSEIIAEFLLNNLNRYNIPTITRQTSYKTETHDAVYDKESNRKEEIIAMQIFSQGNLNIVGEILDYQTPLKNKRTDTAGKIDLLAYDGNTLRILELKKPDSKETLLRCVLEGYTYLNTVDRKKLLHDFKLPDNTEIVACPFVFKNSVQYKEWLEVGPMLKKLINTLNGKPLFITEEYNRYQIFEEE